MSSPSADEHRRTSPAAVTCFVLTISDSRTHETDHGGRLIADLVREAGHALAGHDLVKDDAPVVAESVRAAVAARADVIVTTGGTGISRRDSTYEALASLFDKHIVGFGELFRALSFAEIGPPAMLSRATAGTIGRTAVFVLPGSEHAVRLAMTKLILPELGHVVRELRR